MECRSRSAPASRGCAVECFHAHRARTSTRSGKLVRIRSHARGPDLDRPPAHHSADPPPRPESTPAAPAGWHGCKPRPTSPPSGPVSSRAWFACRTPSGPKPPAGEPPPNTAVFGLVGLDRTIVRQNDPEIRQLLCPRGPLRRGPGHNSRPLRRHEPRRTLPMDPFQKAVDELAGAGAAYATFPFFNGSARMSPR